MPRGRAGNRWYLPILAVMVVLDLEGLLLSPLLLFSPPRLACLAAPSPSLLCVAGAVCVGVVCGCVGACFLVRVTLGFCDHYLVFHKSETQFLSELWLKFLVLLLPNHGCQFFGQETFQQI